MPAETEAAAPRLKGVAAIPGYGRERDLARPGRLAKITVVAGDQGSSAIRRTIMPLVSMRQLLDHAASENSYGIPAFERQQPGVR